MVPLNLKVLAIWPLVEQTFFDRAVCCPISDDVMILLRIHPIRFSNSRVHMNKKFSDGQKNNSLENITWSAMETNRPSGKGLFFVKIR